MLLVLHFAVCLKIARAMAGENAMSAVAKILACIPAVTSLRQRPLSSPLSAIALAAAAQLAIPQAHAANIITIADNPTSCGGATLMQLQRHSRLHRHASI
jgi:hypothetical protein